MAINYPRWKLVYHFSSNSRVNQTWNFRRNNNLINGNNLFPLVNYFSIFPQAAIQIRHQVLEEKCVNSFNKKYVWGRRFRIYHSHCFSCQGFIQKTTKLRMRNLHKQKGNNLVTIWHENSLGILATHSHYRNRESGICEELFIFIKSENSFLTCQIDFHLK